jgi:hypothetical protein
MFAEDQLERLRTFPDIGRDDLILHVDARRRRVPRSWPAAVARLAERLGLDPAVLAGYGQRAHTRSDHVRLAAGYLGWKSAPADSAAMKDLEQFLLDRAIEHDSPGLLFTVAAEYRISAKTIRPGMVTPSATAPNP